MSDSLKISNDLTTTELQAAESFLLIKIHQSLYGLLQQEMVPIRDKCCTLKQFVGNLTNELTNAKKESDAFGLHWLKGYPEMIAHLEYYISAKSYRMVKVLGKLNQTTYKPLVFPVTLVVPHVFVLHFWKRLLERVLMQCNKETDLNAACAWIYSLSKDALTEVLDQFTPLFMQMEQMPVLDKQKERHEQFVASYPLLLAFVQHRSEWFNLQSSVSFSSQPQQQQQSQQPPDKGQLLIVSRLDYIARSLDALVQKVKEMEYETMTEGGEEKEEPAMEQHQQLQHQQSNQSQQSYQSYRSYQPPPPPSSSHAYPTYQPLPIEPPVRKEEEKKDETASLLEKIKQMGEGRPSSVPSDGRPARSLVIRTKEEEEDDDEEEEVESRSHHRSSRHRTLTPDISEEEEENERPRRRETRKRC